MACVLEAQRILLARSGTKCALERMPKGLGEGASGPRGPPPTPSVPFLVPRRPFYFSSLSGPTHAILPAARKSDFLLLSASRKRWREAIKYPVPLDWVCPSGYDGVMLNMSNILARVRSAAVIRVPYLPHAVRQMLRPDRMITTKERRIRSFSSGRGQRSESCSRGWRPQPKESAQETEARASASGYLKSNTRGSCQTSAC